MATFGTIIGRPTSDRPCPHGNVVGECDKGACDEGWDY